jgi:pimeloyl-ACP methyl ester carboxylesterase
MKIIFIFYCVLISQLVFSQISVLDELGFRCITFKYKDDNIDILIKSKKGEENICKPLIIYFQGSLARPLIINYPNDNSYKYSIAFPFDIENHLSNFHFAVISKPYIPIIANVESLDNQYVYIDSIKKLPPIKFLERDHLNYYTKRNNKVVKYMKKLLFVKEIILLGHSEGSRIAFEVAKNSNDVKKLVYLSGNPFGRYMNIVQRERNNNNSNINTNNKDVFDFYLKILENKTIHNYEDGGDSFLSWFNYSIPYFEEFIKFNKKVFIGYGTKDDSSPFLDLLNYFVIINKKPNFTFKAYNNKDHSFYEVKKDGTIDYENQYFNIVLNDIINWIQKE